MHQWMSWVFALSCCLSSYAKFNMNISFSSWWSWDENRQFYTTLILHRFYITMFPYSKIMYDPWNNAMNSVSGQNVCHGIYFCIFPKHKSETTNQHRIKLTSFEAFSTLSICNNYLNHIRHHINFPSTKNSSAVRPPLIFIAAIVTKHFTVTQVKTHQRFLYLFRSSSCSGAFLSNSQLNRKHQLHFYLKTKTLCNASECFNVWVSAFWLCELMWNITWLMLQLITLCKPDKNWTECAETICICGGKYENKHFCTNCLTVVQRAKHIQ